MTLLELTGIGKSFSGIPALRDISLKIESGEIVGLIGENGAGKSTLIRILAGVHQPDAGTLAWLSTPVRFANPHAAISAGIATIHQELAGFDKLTVAENMTLGEPWPRQGWGGTDWRGLNRTAGERLSAAGLEINPRMFFGSLSAAQRQEVAIARALSARSKLLILDEPTASLTEPEVERLMASLKMLRSRGVAILYVSHRLDEILKLTNRVIVLRDGQLVSEFATSEASVGRMIRDMVGRELASVPEREGKPLERVAFRAKELSRAPFFQGASFEVRAGEIVGLGGLIGAGRSELARAIFGMYSADSGSMELEGARYAPRSATEARRSGVVYVPEERKRQGFVLAHSLESAMSIGFLDRVSRFAWISARRERARVESAARSYQIRFRSLQQPIGTLSGGNQQKALLARSLESEPRFIILDEPTRGVDVGAKAEIYRLIHTLADQGKPILLISSDLPELIGLSDRIFVLHRGRISGEFPRGAATQEALLLAASGFRA